MERNKDKVVLSFMKKTEPASGPARALRDAAYPNDVFSTPAPAAPPGDAASPKEESASSGELYRIPVDDVALSPFQTREMISDAELEELAASIRANGLVQPIVVRVKTGAEAAERRYELVCGERRLRAAQLVGLDQIPAVLKDLSDQQAVEFSIIENAQRENLNPIEEALAYRHLVQSFRLTQAEIAQVTGKNRATIANSLRLLHLERRVIDLMKQGALSAGHGRALLMVDDPEVQYRIAKNAALHGLSVRAVEKMVARWRERREAAFSEEDERGRAALERQKEKISSWLGIEQLSLRSDASGKKRLNLVFDSEAAWRRFLAKIRD